MGTTSQPFIMSFDHHFEVGKLGICFNGSGDRTEYAYTVLDLRRRKVKFLPTDPLHYFVRSVCVARSRTFVTNNHKQGLTQLNPFSLKRIWFCRLKGLRRLKRLSSPSLLALCGQGGASILDCQSRRVFELDLQIGQSQLFVFGSQLDVFEQSTGSEGESRVWVINPSVSQVRIFSIRDTRHQMR